MDSASPYSCSDGTGLSTNSVTLEYWDNHETGTRDSALASSAITLCFILVGVPSNLLILVSILRQHLYREPTYILLLSLAIAELLMCLLYMPFTVLSGLYGSFPLGTTDRTRCGVCQFVGILFIFFSYLTVHTLALISVDRFLFIKYPLKYIKMVTTMRTSLACASAWVLCAALSAPPLLGFGDFAYSHTVSSCVINIEDRASNLHYAILVGLEVCFPLLLLFGTNIWILCIILKQMRKLYAAKRKLQEKDEDFKEKLKSKLTRSKHLKQLHLVRVFGAIWLANMITWTPFFARIVGTLIFGAISSRWFLLYVFLSIISHTVIHPLLEATIIPELRKQLVAIFRKALCCCRKRDDPFTTTPTQVACCYNDKLKETAGRINCSLHCLNVLSVTVIPSSEDSANG